jgi:hypothetical protein
MNEQFKILEKKYGHPSKVAKALGITVRHYRRIRLSQKPTQTLKILIDQLANGLDINDDAPNADAVDDVGNQV